MSNIVKAVVGKNAGTIKTAPLYQYDYGQILMIEGIELPQTYQVHFSNDPTGDSTTSIGNENGVDIPDVYLVSGETVYAWLYLHTGENDGETVQKIEIPVRQRAAITNETPTPQQQSEIDQIIEELNEAVDAAEDAQAAAEEAAEQATAAAEHYPVIVDGYWAFWSEEDEQYVKSNQKAQGPQGDPGDPGDPTELIDDTAAAAGKTYSSSKIEAELTHLKSEIQDKAPAIVNITSGNVISFNDGADNAKIMSMIAEIKATQSGTGTASPTNVRPIAGFTGLTIYQSDEDTEDPTTVPVSWESVAGTIYMGTINLTTGLITVTHAYKRYTGASDENWVMTNDGLTGVITWLEVRNLQRLNGVTLCNMSPPNEEWQTPPAYGLVINNASSYNIRASVITEAMTATQFKTWLSTHNLELVCPLTTPVTYQIDPVTINTLLGVNNIWVNTGAITELKYKADTKEYINTSDILLQKIIGKKTFSIFKKVCCIGDSLMNGYIMGSDGVARNDMAYSWVKYMETMTGADYVNCGISGANTRTWLTSENGLAKAQIAANKAQAYIIGLQINDANIGMDVGTVSDIGTDADTYFGHTSKIIDEVFTINNDAHVFLLNQPKNYTGSHTPYMKAIEDIADYYQNNGTHEGQVHLISLLDEIDLFMSAGCADSKADGHYTPVGYEFVAEIMMFALSKYMNEHPMLFQDVNLIPYGS